jgi:large subunit ribosomal protein L10
MAGPRPEKVAVVEEVRERLDNSGAAILTEYRGLKVGDLATLRRQLRTAGAEYKIFKNTLVRLATAGTERAALDPFLEGPTAIAFVRDDVGAVAKVLREFGRVHPELVVKGGLLGTKVVDAKGAGALADLPTREVLLSQLAGAIAAPMRQFASLLQAVPRGLAYGLSALIDQRGGVAAPAEPAAEVPEPADSAEAADNAAATEAPEIAETAGTAAGTDATESAADAAESVETAEATEAGTSEAGTSEAGTSEAGTSEAGTSEAGTSEAGTSEAGTSEPTEG